MNIRPQIEQLMSNFQLHHNEYKTTIAQLMSNFQLPLQ